MPKTEWRDRIQKGNTPTARPKFFKTKEEEKQWKEREKKRTQLKRWYRSEYRAIAQRAIKDLTLIMVRLRKVSDHPERDYAMIFGDGTQYVDMVDACSRAYDISLQGRLRLWTKENIDILRDALSRAGLGYLRRGQLVTLEARQEAIEKLKRKEVEDGILYFKELIDSRSRVADQPTEAVIERSRELLAIWQQIKKEETEKP